ncbi:MAG TPA: DUF5709 domain-containing protein [Mycobacteriales bacterium]|nr:DUF5709 domain-containing protein [Mycobacteriales bacterium]
MTERTMREPTTGLTAEAQEGVTTPADRPVAAFDFGTTVQEQIDGEPLDGRLKREVPDATLELIEALETGAPDTEDLLGAGSPTAGRLVEPDEGARTDDEADVIGRDAGLDDSAFSNEELAMHVVDEDDAGLTDDPDGYVTDPAATDQPH